MNLQFVPLNDELLYDDPELLQLAIVPYNFDYSCHHALADDPAANGREPATEASGHVD